MADEWPTGDEEEESNSSSSGLWVVVVVVLSRRRRRRRWGRRSKSFSSLPTLRYTYPTTPRRSISVGTRM